MLSLVKIGLVEWLQQQTLGIFWSGEPLAQMSFKSFPFKKDDVYCMALQHPQPIHYATTVVAMVFLS